MIVKEAGLVKPQVISNQLLRNTHVDQATRKAIECSKSVLGEESGGFFFDSLFSDDHQVHAIPAGNISG